jgi:hypothetical protein
VAIGFSAGENRIDEDSVYIGYKAGQDGGGSNSVIIGSEASANAASSATSNVCIGYQAGNQVFGYSNVYIGLRAAGGATQANPSEQNVCIGADAGYSITSGRKLALIGSESGRNITTGQFNAAIGDNAGRNITTGSNNYCFGHFSGAESAMIDITTESNNIVIGNSSNTTAYVNVAWTVTSDERDKTDLADLDVGLDFIKAVEPKTFRFDNRSWYYQYDNDGELIDTPEPDGSKKTDILYAGFSAQQVQEAVEATGFPDQIIIDSSDPEHYKMKETAFIPALVKAVQELTARVEQLEAQLNSQ